MTKSELIYDLLKFGFIDQFEADLLLSPDEFSMGETNYPRYVADSTGEYLEITYSLN